MDSDSAHESALGAYLKDRRGRLNPAALGLPPARRRTAGLRREEVAQRANISTTWYTWLEQGRGGAPSASVLDRITQALMLTEAEREHVFLLGLGRMPDVRYRAPNGVTPRLQRVLDSMTASPAFIRTATWDVVAWNKAAAVVLTDYAALEPSERNILRLIFGDPHSRATQPDWESVARYVVAVFRAESARAGALAEVVPLVEELSRLSPEFAAMWQDNDVRGHGDGLKQRRHPCLGLITLEYSAFAVDGRPDLSMVIYNPVSGLVADRIQALVSERSDATTERG
ncbi:helix-turn-helix transcriptional regulator [Sphingomonas prati]|uniref:Transcriptional regulator with XRE-family HTH domain n=1 Tax=Sphingomonas prati TaxID=1843237 RepID=A0A7W9BRX6_9SPHN|nr:helix-turn-helix transcriptional regulator [Sphingomonas prati]MBB5729037.1 transcriptional regulator with XRE-family HTH domain [Sphingomonas prati]GGE85575.1 transcriptional regulator [Sphingomonas prati]